MTTTVVSSLYMGVNKYRSIDDYIMYGYKLLQQPVNKVIYIERDLYEKYYAGETWGANTTFRYISESDIYLTAYDKYVTKFNVMSNNPKKDTKEYMYLMCNKTEWVRRAINENIYDSENFVWLDFGVYHMIQNDNIFNNSIVSLCNKKYDNVRIAGGNKSGGEENLYVNWFFLGTIFGGGKDKLLIFCDKMKERCIEIIKTENRIYWEVNIWYEIWLAESWLYSVYLANHDASILLGY
jgi:hypothetical protein